MSTFPISLDSSVINSPTPNNFTVVFTPEVQISPDKSNMKNFEVALITSAIWYAWTNISASQGNNSLRYYNGATWYTVVIPDGNYQLSDINAYLQAQMASTGSYNSANNTYYISITGNYNTFSTLVTISNSYKLDLSVSTIYTILGFNANTTLTVTTTSPNQADITNGVNSLQIHSSLVEGVYANGQVSDILYTFSPQVPPGSQIVLSPVYPIYVPVVRTQSIKQIRMSLTDQLGRPINILGGSANPINYFLHLREVQ
jgi:hypothetical protein